MTRGADLQSCARMLCSWLLISVLAVVVTGTYADAASMSVSWTAPTTNADGTPVTDLASYRVYFGTTVPSCPGAPFRIVPSPTTTPSPGETITTVVTGLTANTTHHARVTAVDASGNEGACSPAASGVAQAAFTVTPTTATSFGALTVGTTADRTFTVQNTSTVSISGSVTVPTPFSIASGGSFTLAAGASQTVVVRFQPTTTGTFAVNATFTAGGDTVSRSVSGSATSAATATLSVTKNGTGSGTVTSSPAGIACGATCTQSVAVGTQLTLTATPNSGSTFTGWSGACTGTAACSVTVNTNTAVTATFTASAGSAPVPGASSLSPSTAVAGSSSVTVTVNGSGFVASSVALWDGAARTTTVLSSSQLRFTVTASDLATPRSVPVSVSTPPPGGGTSGTVAFVITASGPASEIIIDNAAPDVQDAAGGRTYTGRWCLSSATNKFGPSSLYSCGFRWGTTYRWTPQIPTAGTYDVYVWFASSATRSGNVPITVRHAGGNATRQFDQRSGGGQWVLHGRYAFNAGATGYVQTSAINGLASADAARFVRVTGVSSSSPPAFPAADLSPGLVTAQISETNSETLVDTFGRRNNASTPGPAATHSASLNLRSATMLEAWLGSGRPKIQTRTNTPLGG